ncbi:MAG: LysM peptidoglycan-binding domain-containing protein [Anaerolineales bacterium]|jgi:hypothetical protein|nr:LysM peptidoglycan-binding domain-containing protein [Anaerolineales bacterium]MCC6986817.1 LysM peptidoglycan-binding domain-containing protein [Anaerolineales bacterium]
MKYFFISITVIGATLAGSFNMAGSVLSQDTSSAGAMLTTPVEPLQETTGETTPFVDLVGVQEINFQPGVEAENPAYAFGNPAGCAASAPNPSPEEMLAKVQQDLGDSIVLNDLREFYIWNGPLGTMLNVTDDPFVYEFRIKMYQSPQTYQADQLVTTFLTNGFVVWLRKNANGLHLLAVPMTPGALESSWAGYITAYWQINGYPQDETIVPILKKLPCHWVIDQGYVGNETLQQMFDFNWQIPDYLSAGRQYLASNCQEANRISQEEIGFWDASSMCGPLAWTIIKDANGFPYRIGDWYADASIFTAANPKWNGRPWLGFDPETYDVFHTDTPMPGYDFAANGDLHTGDILYSYSTLYQSPDERFDHIFMVAGVDENNARISISNMIQNLPTYDCFIREITLYTPGDLANGVINKEWNSYENGRTGVMGFDIFRWKWQTHHLEGQAREYTVRFGDTLETIAFDWKIPPQSIADANHIRLTDQLLPGQTITLPQPEPGYK